MAALVCGLFFVFAGAMHFVLPNAYRSIVPPYLPSPDALVLLSGIAEIVGGIGLIVQVTRRIAGIGLILLLFAVWPANFEMLFRYRAQGVGALGETLLWLRLPLQIVLIWWVWRISNFRRHSQNGGRT